MIDLTPLAVLGATAAYAVFVAVKLVSETPATADTVAFDAARDCDHLAEECLLEHVATPAFAPEPEEPEAPKPTARLVVVPPTPQPVGVMFAVGDVAVVAPHYELDGTQVPISPEVQVSWQREAQQALDAICRDVAVPDPKVEPAAPQPKRGLVEVPTITNACKPLEVRESRRVAKEGRMTYARRVYDACKAKFGTPKNTEANHKAVWRYAQTVMKDHGVRPSQQSEFLPMIVSKVFIPSLEELVAGRQVGVYQRMIDGRFDETLSTWDKWCRKLKRHFSLPA